MRNPPNSRFPAALPASLKSIAALVSFLSFPAFAAGTPDVLVIEDSPSRLILEVEVPAPVIENPEEGQTEGNKVKVAGFVPATTPGAPALPWYTFQVAAGAALPSVRIDPFEWVEVALPAGLAGVPKPITSRTFEPFKDPALFAAARGLAPKVSEIQLYRGLKLRQISLPIATYDGSPAAANGRARVLKKFRVTTTFAGASSAPAAGVKPWLIQADVKNPGGGQYLVSLPRRTALQRSGRSATTALSSGSYLKIKVGDRILDGFEEDGVYSLTYEAALSAGMPAGQDTGKIRLYKGPQGVLGVPMGSLLNPTLNEIPIQIVEGTTGTNPNGTFDAGDRILFYGHGTSLWKPIPDAAGAVLWAFTNDLYSFENYYFLDWGGTATGALRLGTTPFVPAATTVTTVPHYVRGEKDIGTGSCDPSSQFDGETGPNWWWYWKVACSYGPNPGFSTSTPTLTGAQLRSAPADTLKERVPDSLVYLGLFSFDGPFNGFRAFVASQEFSFTPVDAPGSWYFGSWGAGESQYIDSVQWLEGGRRFEGYTVRYVRRLAWTGRARHIFPSETGQRIVYQVDGAVAGLRVLRLVNGVAQQELGLQTVGATLRFSDSVGANDDVRYFLYQNPVTVAANAITLESMSSTSGVIQNLVTGDAINPEYLIISPRSLLPEALELRNYRDNAARHKRWNTAVVRTEDIYREWSGGRLSPVAIRDFLRFALNRWGTGGTQGNLKHVVFFGDGHYDYRNIRNGGSNSPKPNNIPPFNTDFADANPMSVDDFYATLDSGEVWTDPGLDISLGRLPIQTRDQATAYLEKVRRYEDPALGGEWRSRILLTGDDDKQGSANDQLVDHTTQAEGIGNVIVAQESGMRPEKLYLFDYPSNSSFLKPEATQDLINLYNRGVVFSTFFGHGAYNQLADEVLLKTSDGLSRFKNTDRLFLFSAFSCTVGRFDKLADEGMSEQFLRVAGIGAIGAVSGSRETYPDPNEELAINFSNALFGPASDSGARPMGEALRLGKNASTVGTQLNKMKYILQGEPVLLIHRPSLGITLDTVADTLQALGCDTVSGRVAYGSGRGKVSLRIVSGDVPKSYPAYNGFINSVKKQGQILFERTVDYQDSAFSIAYFLPKQVPFGDTAAKIQVFAWDAEQLRESAVLVSNRKIQGTGTCVVDSDGRGPRITVTGCNTKESGGVDFPDKVKISLPYCLQITVNDTVGGVQAGTGPDEGTMVEVVGSVAPFHPQAGVDDLYTKTYQLTLSDQDVAEGTHLLKVTARDGFGNLGTRQINLQVSQDTVLRFIKAFNVPNPMKRSGTTFHFATTLPVEEGGVQESPRVDRIRFDLRIFNQQGYMVQEFRNAASGETRWDGKDAWGRQLANGVYFYQVTATWGESDGSPVGGRQVSKKNVLVISR